MQDAALLADFASMYRNTLSYKTTRNVRPSTVEMALECEVIISPRYRRDIAEISPSTVEMALECEVIISPRYRRSRACERACHHACVHMHYDPDYVLITILITGGRVHVQPSEYMHYDPDYILITILITGGRVHVQPSDRRQVPQA